MATLGCDSDPDPKPDYHNANVVFIDTNLDTHLAVLVSHQDTVSDLKKRILSEHPLCFPKIGQIQIHAIKVKRKGYFYHLSDSMVVKSAFHGFNKSWFLSVDASALGDCGQNEQLCSSGSPNKVACLDNANYALIGPVDIVNNDEKEEIPFSNPCVSEYTGKEAVKNLGPSVKSFDNNANGIPLPVAIPETQEHCYVNPELPVLQIECEVDGSSKAMKDDCNVCEENPSISVASAKKKRKSKRKKEDMVQDDTPKENTASVDNPLSFASKKVSSFDTFQVPELENKHDEREEFPLVSPCVSEHSGKELVKNLETGVKSSISNDPDIPLPGSIPETQDHCCVNHELSSSQIECEVDGSSKGIKDDCIVHEEGTSKSMPIAKKKRKSKKKKEDTVPYDTSKENDASVVGPGNGTVKQDIVLANPSENADKKVIQETEVLKEHQHTECNDNNTKNDFDSESMKEASNPGHAANKKHKKRKRSTTHDSEEMLKAETASQKDEAQKYEAQKSGDAHKDRKESKDLFEFNTDKSRDDAEYKHNKVAEDVSDAKPSAKKKQKGKEKGGDKSLPKETLSMKCDIKEDNASHHLLEEQQKINNSSADQIEHFNDTDALRTREQGGRRKRKKNSSKPHETPVITSSRKENEANPSSIPGEAVQEEISEDGLFSKDIRMCKEGMSSKVKNTINEQNHCDIDMKVRPSDVNEPKELTEDNENIVLDHHHKSEAGQTEGAEEGREVSAQNDPKLVLLEKCTPSNPDNTHANINESNVTSKVVDVNGMTEPVKSEKKRRGIRKSKDSAGGPAPTEDIGLVDASESEAVFINPLNATNCDPKSGNRTDIDLMSGQIMHKLEATKGQTQAESLISSQQLSSMDEYGLRFHPDKKAPNLREPGHDAKLSSRSNSPMSSIRENGKPQVEAVGKSMDLEKQREHHPKSNMKLEGPKKKAQNKVKNVSRNNIGEVVSNTRQKKSLLAGAIFKDDSSSNSEDEVDNSDASTRTPSDDSLLSDFSDGDNNAGSHGGKRLENGGRSALKASLSGTKGMPIDHILRSSSRYKKAKVKASQLEGSDSQPEIVPDSLADM